MMNIALLLVIFCFESNVFTYAHLQNSRTDIVLVGALGDLSKKYLWQSVFNLYLKYNNNNTTFRFYGCGLRDTELGKPALKEVLETKVVCDPPDKLCEKSKSNFVKMVQYFPTKTQENFDNLSSELDRIEFNETKSWRKGRIFYLAITPSAFITTAEKLYKCCYRNDGSSWTRIVLEKPFGSDKESAKQLAHDIAKYYKEEEIYRVDHYLAKSVVKQILPFRDANREKLEKYLHKNYIDRVEIVMKETIGVKGRIDFYDQYGVFRDVMQNHLTELLTLITMELPRNISNRDVVENNRLQLLQRVNAPTRKSVLLGQYSKYTEDAKSEKENTTLSRYTPTFGAALFSVDNYRWQNVPFLLVSGKHLDERSSFIRIVFKDRDICMSSCNIRSNNTHFLGPKQIIFQIGHGNLPSAGILVSKSLIDPKWPNGLVELAMTAAHFSDYGQNLNDFTFGIPVQNVDAYSTVIEDLYKGEQKSFVGTQRLLKLWDIWSPIIQEIQREVPHIYLEEKDPSLNFRIENGGLEFISNSVKMSVILEDDKFQRMATASIPGMFLGSKLVTDNIDELFRHAAYAFKTTAVAAVEERNVFHVAFSGGRTPNEFLKVLAELDLPWNWIHIWQVDERCVPQTDTLSNFNMLQKELLDVIRIPYLNVHPMPVDMAGRICDPKDQGFTVYRDLLQYLIPSLSFDLIILGVGLDGHTASLFSSNKDILGNHNDLVVIASSDKVIPSKRMTLTFPVINKSKEVFILVAGKAKREILQNIQKEGKTLEDYPILGLDVRFGNVTWFVDHDALLFG